MVVEELVVEVDVLVWAGAVAVVDELVDELEDEVVLVVVR